MNEVKDLKAIRGQHYIKQLIEEGEHLHQDFKFAISDARKIARSISAFANNDGGSLLIGVKDNGVIAGIRTEEDIYLVEQAAQMYCRPEQTIEFTAYKTEGGNVVVKADVKKAELRPVKAIDDSGKWKAYYRVNDENIMASSLMVRAWNEEQTYSGAVFRLSQSEKTLLDILTDKEMMSINELMTTIHVSRQKIERMIINLYLMHVVEFIHDGKEFKIALNTEK